MAEAASAADALQKSLDAEVADRSALEAVVASECEGLGVSAGASGSSLRSHVDALYSRAGERMREALHARVKKALAVVSSHYVSIDLPAVSEGYVRPDNEAEAQEELQKLGDAADAPEDALATFFDAKVELAPSARRNLGNQGSRALVVSFFLLRTSKASGPCFLYEILMLKLNIYMIVPFKISFMFLVISFSLCRPDLDSAGSGELLRVCASQSVPSLSPFLFLSNLEVRIHPPILGGEWRSSLPVDADLSSGSHLLKI